MCEQEKYNASEFLSDSKLSDNEILELYKFLEHGSDDHKSWLLGALFHYFKGTPLPEYKV